MTMQKQAVIVYVSGSVWLTHCISSILEKTPNTPIVLVYGDNDITIKESLFSFSTMYDNVHTLITDGDYVTCVNNAIAFLVTSIGDAKYYAITCDTAVVSTGWLDVLTSHMEINQSLAIAAPVSNIVDGRQNTKYNNTKYDKEIVEYVEHFCYVIKSDTVKALISHDGYFIDSKYVGGHCVGIDLGRRIQMLHNFILVDRCVYVHCFVIPMTQDNSVLLTTTPQRAPNILFAVPCASEYMHFKFWMSSMSLNIPYAHAFEVAPRLSIEEARNKLSDIAIEHGFTHILFCDDDHIYDDQDIVTKLVEANKDVIGVRAYTRKHPHFPCMFYKCHNSDFYQDMDFENVGLRELDAIGFAVTLVNVDVLRAIKKRDGVIFERRKVKLLGRDDGTFGEDITFCKKAKELGYGVWVDTSIEVAHLGEPTIITSKSRRK